MTAAVLPLAPGPPLGQVADAFLGRPGLDPDTRRSYAQTMTRGITPTAQPRFYR